MYNKNNSTKKPADNEKYSRREFIRMGAATALGAASVFPLLKILESYDNYLVHKAVKDYAVFVIDMQEELTNHAERDTNVDCSQADNKFNTIEKVLDVCKLKKIPVIFFEYHLEPEDEPNKMFELGETDKRLLKHVDKPKILLKKKYSGFSNESLIPTLKEYHTKKIVVMGYDRDGCVLETAKDALTIGFEVHASLDTLIGTEILGFARPERLSAEEKKVIFEIEKKTMKFKNIEFYRNHLNLVDTYAKLPIMQEDLR